MKLFTNLFTLLYPIIFFTARDLPSYLISILLLSVAIINLYIVIKLKFTKTDIFVPIIFLFVGVFSFFIHSNIIFRMIPAVISFYFLSLFAKSNFSDTTLIEHFASIRHKEVFNTQTILYFKKLNWIWTWFLSINLLIQIIVIFMPLYIWVLYTSVISYLLMGTLFIVEFIYRKLIWEPNN